MKWWVLALWLTGCGVGAGGMCRSDRECTGRGLVCDLVGGQCVECVSMADCTMPNQRCLANRCVTPVPCTSTRMCPGQVCDTTQGICVDCVENVDCPSGQRCSNNGCVGTMSTSMCTPGARDCADARTTRVCNSSGNGYSTSVCAAGQRCSAGRCVSDSGCIAPAQACGTAADCCNGRSCRASPDQRLCCSEAGGACTNSLECCGFMLCENSRCACLPAGRTCTVSSDCCSMACVYAPGTTMGTCR